MFGKIVKALLLSSLFLLFLLPPTDPDLGWHLACGQQIWQTGRLCDVNTFSVLLPNYYWPNPYWLYEAVIYPVFELLGPWGLSLLNTVTVCLAFYFVIFKSKSLLTAAFGTIVLLLTSYFVFSLGIRSQIVGFLFFCALLSLLGSNQKYRFWLALPILLLWVQFHGSFPLGLLLIFAFSFAQILQSPFLLSLRGEKRRSNLASSLPATKKGNPLPIVLLPTLLSPLIPLLNPFGFGLYQVAWRHVSNAGLDKLIAEWVPPSWPTLFFIVASLIFAAIVYLTSYYHRHPTPTHLPSDLSSEVLTKEEALAKEGHSPQTTNPSPPVPDYSLPASRSLGEGWLSYHLVSYLSRLTPLLLLLPLAFLAFAARRQVPLYFAAFVYLVLPAIPTFPSLPNFPRPLLHRLSYLTLGCFLLYLAFTSLPKTFTANQNMSSCLKQQSDSPCGAITFFKNQKTKGVIFNRYEWGGFLIWELPDYHIFVDGRMPAWPTPEGKSPYTLYLETLQTQPGWEDTLTKYQTNWILISPGTFMDLLLRPNPEKYGWRLAYLDPVSVIYQANPQP